MSPPVGAVPVKCTLCVPLTQCQVTASPVLTVTLSATNLSPPLPTWTVAGAATAGPARARVARPAASARGVDADRRMGVSSRDGGVLQRRDGDPSRTRFGRHLRPVTGAGTFGRRS